MRAPGKVCLLSAALLAAGCGVSGGGAAGVLPTPVPSGSPPPTPTPTPTPEGPGSVFTVAPAAASQHVFVANPDNDDVANVDTATLHIDVIPVGVKPLDLRVAPNGSYLATFNELSHDVSRVDLTATPPLVTPLAVRPVTNAMFTSPLATHGICIYTAARDTGTGSGGSTSPDEVSIVDLLGKNVVSAVMGALPRQVAFTPDDAKGFVLSDGLLAEIDLTQPTDPRRFIALAADPTSAPLAKQVAVAPDGQSAVVLTADTSQGLLLVNTSAGTFSSIAVGNGSTTPTDLELTADGRFFAVASLGTSSVIDLFDRANGFARTSVTIPGPAGSLALAPDRDVLYAFTRSINDDHLWRLDVNPGAGGPAPVLTRYSVVRPVRDVYVAPSPGGVVVLHRTTSPADPDRMTVLDPNVGVPLLAPVTLAGPPDKVAVTSDGAYAFAEIPSANQALVIDLTSLLVDTVQLSSTPLFVGTVPGAHTGYLLEQHPLGRLSFIDPATLSVQTVTGFEINGGIQ